VEDGLRNPRPRRARIAPVPQRFEGLALVLDVHRSGDMRVASLAALALLVDLAVPARADAQPTSLEGWTTAIGSRQAPDAPASAPAPGPAEGAGSLTKKSEEGGPRFSFGVNSPLSWLRKSFGASLAIGVNRHHAIRANFARYNPDDLLLLLAAGGERLPRIGSIQDLGLSWTYYPRKLWDGVMLELGAIRRERDVQVLGDVGEDWTTRSVAYGGRATVGWSWRLGRAWFVSIAAGLSVSREVGKVTAKDDLGMVTTKIDRTNTDPEIYMRLGFAFGP